MSVLVSCRLEVLAYTGDEWPSLAFEDGWAPADTEGLDDGDWRMLTEAIEADDWRSLRAFLLELMDLPRRFVRRVIGAAVVEGLVGPSLYLQQRTA